MSACLTPQEWKNYMAYMKISEPEEQKEVNVSLKALLERGAVEAINDYTQEIGVLRHCIETFNNDRTIIDYCTYLIELYKIFIEEEYRNVKRWRKEPQGI